LLSALEQFLLTLYHAHQVSILALLAAQNSTGWLTEATLGRADYVVAKVRLESLLLGLFPLQLPTWRRT
jgi:hypothetical protein